MSSTPPKLDRRNFLTALATGSIAGTLAARQVLPSGAMSKPSNTHQAFEKLKQTGQLNCGYNFWEPGLFQGHDGQPEGFIVDVMHDIEHYTKIKFNLSTIIDWGNIASELNAGKIDIMCAGMWNAVDMAKHMQFSRPISYQALEAIVRADDLRFEHTISAINDPSVTIAVIDNADTAYIANNEFPKAQQLSMPMLASDAEMLLNVATGKADVMFTNPGIAAGFINANPGQVKRASPGHRLRVYGNTLVVAQGEQELLNFLNLAIEQLINMGKIDQHIDYYNSKYPDTFLKPQRQFIDHPVNPA